MRRTLLLIALLAAGCGGRAAATDGTARAVAYQTCADVPGTHPNWVDPCVDDNGMLQASGWLDCSDGRKLHMNAGGWAFDGDVAQANVDADGVAAPPTAVYWGCQG